MPPGILLAPDIFLRGSSILQCSHWLTELLKFPNPIGPYIRTHVQFHSSLCYRWVQPLGRGNGSSRHETALYMWTGTSKIKLITHTIQHLWISRFLAAISIVSIFSIPVVILLTASSMCSIWSRCFTSFLFMYIKWLLLSLRANTRWTNASYMDGHRVLGNGSIYYWQTMQRNVVIQFVDRRK